MDILARIDELKKKAPKPKWRAAHGQWIPYAWVVRGLVEQGHGVMDSVRLVVSEENIEPADTATKSIRQAYYEIRKRPWPEQEELK